MEGVFVNAERLTPDIRPRIPTQAYWLRGLGGTRLRCLPVAGVLTRDYLDALHNFDAEGWNAGLADRNSDLIVAWRDGESPFLFPRGLEREERWLTEETGVERRFLSECSLTYLNNDELAAEHLRSYPVHSFLAWMKEFPMIGYLDRLQRQERDLNEFTSLELALWLQAINSDVLSAVEKQSPVVPIRSSQAAGTTSSTRCCVRNVALRARRYLDLLERARAGEKKPIDRFLASDEPHGVKFRGRFEYLKGLLAPDGAND